MEAFTLRRFFDGPGGCGRMAAMTGIPGTPRPPASGPAPVPDCRGWDLGLPLVGFTDRGAHNIRTSGPDVVQSRRHHRDDQVAPEHHPAPAAVTALPGQTAPEDWHEDPAVLGRQRDPHGPSSGVAPDHLAVVTQVPPEVRDLRHQRGPQAVNHGADQARVVEGEDTESSVMD